MGKKVVKLYFGNGYSNCDHKDFEELPEDWESMTEVQQQEYLDSAASNFMEQYADYSATVVDTDEDEDYEPNWYSA